MKLEKIQIFILHFDLGTPGLIKNFFWDANFMPVALTIKDRQ